MELGKKVLIFNKIIKTYKMKVNQKVFKRGGSQITYLEVGNDLFAGRK